MTTLVHALIGVAIANKIQNPYLAGSTALLSHFLCDAIPHWDLGTDWRSRRKLITGSIAILETIISLVLIYIIFSPLINPLLLMFTVLVSISPDVLTAPYFIFHPHSPKLFYYIYKVQSTIHSRNQTFWGILTQIITVVIFLSVGFLF